MMRIGLDSYSFQIALAAGAYDLFRALDRLEALGVVGLQININGPDGRFLGADPSDTAHVRRVRRAFEQKGFFVEVAGHGTRPELLDGQLRLCAGLGADVFRTLLLLEDGLQATFDRARRDLEVSLSQARKLGVRVALENHEDVTSAELLAFVAGMDDPHLGVCLDTGNDLALYDDPLRGAELLASRALTTHVKDQRLVRIAGEVYSVGVPLGTGDVDLPAVMSVIVGQSDLDRVLVQDTYGYATRLNPFGRPDLSPLPSHRHLPEYGDAAAALEHGLLLDLGGLSPESLRAQARLKDQFIEQDVAYLRRLLEDASRAA